MPGNIRGAVGKKEERGAGDLVTASDPAEGGFRIELRNELREFGLDLGDDVTVHVWDSSAETRYMVLPERPAGTEGMTEEQLAALVTRDAMIGVATVSVEPLQEGARR